METTIPKKVTFKKWDPAKYINTKEAVIAHIEAALEIVLEENDPDFLLKTIGHIARSKGMAQIARELNLDRAGLYKSLAPDGNPSFKTVFKLLDILGLQIRLEKKGAQDRPMQAGEPESAGPSKRSRKASKPLSPEPAELEPEKPAGKKAKN